MEQRVIPKWSNPIFVGLMATLLGGCQEFALDKVDTIVPEGDPAVDSAEDTAGPSSEPDIYVDPESISFPPVPPGCDAEPVVVTVTNVGDGPLDISNVVMNGPDGVHFTFDRGATPPFRVRPGVSFEMSVGFTAPDVAVYDRVLVLIESNDPDEAQVRVPLVGEGFEGETREDRFTQNVGNTVVDVLFVVDNSESMEDNLADFAAAMDVFIDEFLDLGLDFHLGVTTMDMSSTGAQGELLGPVITSTTPNPVDVFRAQVADAIALPGAGNERGYEASKSAMSPPRNTSAPNNAFARQQANLAVVVVSDEDDGDANPEGLLPQGRDHITDNYVGWLQSQRSTPDAVSFSGMVGPRTGGLIACGFASTSATRAPQYRRAIDSTGGVWSNICNMDVSPFLNHLSYVARGLDTSFALSAVPAETGCDAIEVLVNGQPVDCQDPVNGWVYDPTTNEVEISGTAIPSPGQEVVIRYPVSQECR